MNNKWISVKDRLPNLPGEYWINTSWSKPSDKPYWSAGIMTAKWYLGVWQIPGGSISTTEITHWMPIEYPEPPGEEL